VTGDCCFTALLRAVFAEERKDRKDARANGILDVTEKLETRVGRAPALNCLRNVVLEVVGVRLLVFQRFRETRDLTSSVPLISLTVSLPPFFLV
jgi:hypothetical protein